MPFRHLRRANKGVALVEAMLMMGLMVVMLVACMSVYQANLNKIESAQNSTVDTIDVVQSEVVRLAEIQAGQHLTATDGLLISAQDTHTRILSPQDAAGIPFLVGTMPSTPCGLEQGHLVERRAGSGNTLTETKTHYEWDRAGNHRVVERSITTIDVQTGAERPGSSQTLAGESWWHSSKGETLLRRPVLEGCAA